MKISMLSYGGVQTCRKMLFNPASLIHYFSLNRINRNRINRIEIVVHKISTSVIGNRYTSNLKRTLNRIIDCKM